MSGEVPGGEECPGEPEHGPTPRPVPPLSPRPASTARIVLVGPPAAGKSTIGRLVADRLDLPMEDTDQEIVRRHGPIPEIFSTRGEARFRAIEREVVRRSLRKLLDRPGVVSLGGGAVLNPGTRAQLRHPALRVVLIEIDEDTARERLHGSGRPLLAGDPDPVEAWKTLVEDRRALYEAVGSIRVSASNGPPSTVVNRIVDVLAGLQRKEEYARFSAEAENQ
ncbi:shikimate kinase [Brevibacterium litoralis]|uniref:shikimate kinase n=1 Tax=Brevibacterium litoralis TaxID=3138935 RepID=UPI0032F08D74